MIRSLLKLGLLALVCIVIYRYFFGTTEQKAQSKRIFNGVETVFVEARDIVRDEREKFDKGKYDKALDKLQDAIQRLKSHANETNDASLKSRVADLERRKNDLERNIDAIDAEPIPKGQNTGNKPYVGSKSGNTAPPPPTKTPQADKVQKALDASRQIESLATDIESLVKKAQHPSE